MKTVNRLPNLSCLMGPQCPTYYSERFERFCCFRSWVFPRLWLSRKMSIRTKSFGASTTVLMGRDLESTSFWSLEMMNTEVKKRYRCLAKFWQFVTGWVGGFGQRVLGDTWIRHHGNHGNESTRGIVNEEFAEHPILAGRLGTDWYAVVLA